MEALGISLLALGYERDELSTPRIAAVVSLDSDEAWLAIIRRGGLQVESVKPKGRKCDLRCHICG